MNFSKFNVARIVISFILTLGLLLAGRFAYEKVGIVEPVRKDVLAVSAVQRVEVTAEQGVLTVSVEMGEVDSLKHSYQTIKQLLPLQQLNKLDVHDRRNEYLTNLWKENQFAMEEAATLGNFTEMQQLIEERLSRENLDSWQLEIDDENLYLQIHYNGYYLYEIVPRHDFLVVSEKM